MIKTDLWAKYELINACKMAKKEPKNGQKWNQNTKPLSKGGNEQNDQKSEKKGRSEP